MPTDKKPVSQCKRKKYYTDVQMRDQMLVVMMGTSFQSQYLHELVATKKTVGPRLSLTLRVSNKQSGFRLPPSMSIVFVIHPLAYVTFEEVYEEVRDFLEPDITRMFGKVFTNNGRLVADMVLPEHLPFTYKYAGKAVEGRPVTPVIQRLFHLLRMNGHGAYDWVHIVYYPDGSAKLGPHSDDEPEIQHGFPIAGLSLFANKEDTRTFRLRPKQIETPLVPIYHIN